MRISVKKFLFLAVWILIAAFPAVEATAQEAEPADAAESSAVVTLDGAPLFRVRGTATFSAEKRAEAVRQRIVDAALLQGRPEAGENV